MEILKDFFQFIENVLMESLLIVGRQIWSQ